MGIGMRSLSLSRQGSTLLASSQLPLLIDAFFRNKLAIVL